jgi:TonB family protein
MLAPPYAVMKVLPHFSADLARRDRDSMIVVYGVINTAGRWQSLHVMQGSADAKLGAAVQEALAEWSFKPAELNGNPVPVKCLLGVPVSSVPVD